MKAPNDGTCCGVINDFPCEGCPAAKAPPSNEKPKRHDHRQSFWVLSNRQAWCYRCGAVRFTQENGRSRWIKPTGDLGENPAAALRRLIK